MDYLFVLVTFLLLWQNIMTKKLTEGSIYARFKFQKVRTMMVKQRHGIRSRMLRVHILTHRQEAEQTKNYSSFKPSKPAPKLHTSSINATPPKPPQNSTISCGPRTQMLRLWGSSHPSHHAVFSQKRNLFKKWLQGLLSQNISEEKFYPPVKGKTGSSWIFSHYRSECLQSHYGILVRCF